MQLSEKVLDYIKFTSIPRTIKSNFLITDLEKVIYSTTIEEEDKEYYISKTLSNDLSSLIKEWSSLPISENLKLLQNSPCIDIIENDSKHYDSLMVFPIYISDKIERFSYFL